MMWVLIFVVVFAALIALCAWLASKFPRPSLTVPLEIRLMHARQQREEQERRQRDRERIAEISARTHAQALADAIREDARERTEQLLRFQEIIHSDTERTLVCNQMEPGQVVSIQEDGLTTHVQGPNTQRTGNSQGVPVEEPQQLRRFRDE